MGIGLENGEYALTMKESDRIIINAIPVNGNHLAYRPDKEYKLIVNDGIYVIFDEQYADGLELLEMKTMDWFNIKKVA